MIHKLVRYEKSKDHIGKIVSIFVATTCDDGLGNSYYNEHFLTTEEMTLVLADETKLMPILEKLCATGVKNLNDFIITKPQPTIYADQTKLNSFIISDIKIQILIKPIMI